MPSPSEREGQTYVAASCCPLSAHPCPDGPFCRVFPVTVSLPVSHFAMPTDWSGGPSAVRRGVRVSAAVVPAVRRRSSRRRWLHSVPELAGPPVKCGPGHPLALGQDARGRFAGAVRALLDAPGLEGVADAVRLAVVVLAARTPSETGVVEIRARELGRWLGLSESRVRHAVVPGLRRSGVVDVETLAGCSSPRRPWRRTARARAR
jgi:hypothetical protein